MSPARADFARAVTSFQPLLGVGIHNPLTAALAERAGFDLLWLSSFELTGSRMLPDSGVISFGDVVPVVADIAAATQLPIIVDADNGYGSASATRLAVQRFARAGASAVCIEDNALPKRNSFLGNPERQLETIDEACSRIEAARAASHDMVVIARTEALVAGLGAREGVRRARAYVEAGAHALFVQTRRTTFVEYQAVLEQVRGRVPVLLTPTAVPERTSAEIYEMGVQIVIHANLVIRTLVHAVSEVLDAVRGGTCLSSMASRVASMDDVLALSHSLVGAGPSAAPALAQKMEA